MASNATNPTSGRMARAIQWPFPSRRQVAVSLAADLGIAILGLPFWMHLALSVAVHTAAHLVGRHR